MTTDMERLRERYRRWVIQRRWLNRKENMGEYVRASYWQDSDDEAVELLVHLAAEVGL